MRILKQNGDIIELSVAEYKELYPDSPRLIMNQKVIVTSEEKIPSLKTLVKRLKEVEQGKVHSSAEVKKKLFGKNLRMKRHHSWTDNELVVLKRNKHAKMKVLRDLLPRHPVGAIWTKLKALRGAK
jgi:hypothetical protein